MHLVGTALFVESEHLLIASIAIFPAHHGLLEPHYEEHQCCLPATASAVLARRTHDFMTRHARRARVAWALWCAGHRLARALTWTFFLLESPRWLIQNGFHAEGLWTLGDLQQKEKHRNTGGLTVDRALEGLPMPHAHPHFLPDHPALFLSGCCLLLYPSPQSSWRFFIVISIALPWGPIQCRTLSATHARTRHVPHHRLPGIRYDSYEGSGRGGGDDRDGENLVSPILANELEKPKKEAQISTRSTHTRTGGKGTATQNQPSIKHKVSGARTMKSHTHSHSVTATEQTVSPGPDSLGGPPEYPATHRSIEEGGLLFVRLKQTANGRNVGWQNMHHSSHQGVGFIAYPITPQKVQQRQNGGLT
ncbi:hypothetical protein B0H14DRAFT_2656109 [Mycena olivaceomarginata]|nr:hypothetical protein B0H14DRAFT_2656109 [Mycena olivaceomarginata]